MTERDASVGNVLLDRQGAAVLMDLDGFTISPREWDLVLTAMYYDSFGWHTRQEYEDFARVYGYDITGCLGTRSCGRVPARADDDRGDAEVVRRDAG